MGYPASGRLWGNAATLRCRCAGQKPGRPNIQNVDGRDGLHGDKPFGNRALLLKMIDLSIHKLTLHATQGGIMLGKIKIKGGELDIEYGNETATSDMMVRKIRKLAYDNCVHEIEVLGHRADLFLIFHAILLEAFFNAAGHENESINLTLIGILGAGIAFAWLRIGLRQYWRINYLSEAVASSGTNDDETFVFHRNLEHIHKSNQKHSTNSLLATPVLALYIPMGIFVTWLLLMLFNSQITWVTPLIMLTASVACLYPYIGSIEPPAAEQDCKKLYELE